MKIIKNLIGFALVFAGSLLALEFYLQLAEIQNPMETRIDPVIGPTFVPNLKVTHFKEGFHIGHTNAYGYLGEESPRRRISDEYRILMLGDSFVMGRSLFERHHFIHIVEQNLSLSTGRRVDALNFGKDDFALANMYAYYRNFACGFDHDLALFFVGIRDLLPSRQRDPDLYPSCELQNGNLVIEYGLRESTKINFYRRIEFVGSHSAFCRMALNTRKVVKSGNLSKQILDRLYPILFPDCEPVPYQPPRDLKLTDIVTAILRDLARSRSNILVYKEDMPQEIRSAVEAIGIRTIDLSPIFRDMEADGRNPYYWKVSGMTGHWNHDAHREIGRRLSRSLAADIDTDRIIDPSEHNQPSPGL